jgi:hypothetical protein
VSGAVHLNCHAEAKAGREFSGILIRQLEKAAARNDDRESKRAAKQAQNRQRMNSPHVVEELRL